MGPQAVSVIDVERVYDGWQHSLWRKGGRIKKSRTPYAPGCAP